MNNQFIIDEIQRKSKISDYLAEKGVSPARVNSDKMVYLCPLPGHSTDKAPSFCIYDKGDHEDFWCYGCKRGGGVIQFISEYEGISFKDAISRLSDGLDIDLSDIMDRVIEEVKKANQGNFDDHQTVLQTVMYVSSLCHDYFLRTNKSWDEVLIFEKMFALCDSFMKSRDKKKIEELSRLLPSIMGKRYKEFARKKEKDEIREIVRWSKV